MDFDLAQVRAFVAVADQHHFGRAATGLHLTQQALSRRIQRLEQLLGRALFVRNSSGAELTPTGRRFLAPARQLLAIADTAGADAKSTGRPLRVDVWGFRRMAPLRFVEQLARAPHCLEIEPSMRRNICSAMEALQRGEVDVAFGRVHDLDRPWPPGLRRRIAQLEPAAVLLSVEHPLSASRTIRPAELRGSTLLAPPASTAPEMLLWIERFAMAFDITVQHDAAGVLGADPLADPEQLRPADVVIRPVDSSIESPLLRIVPLTDPVPRFAWSVIWRRNDQSPSLARFLHLLTEMGRAEGWTTYDPECDWLPEPDRADP